MKIHPMTPQQKMIMGFISIICSGTLLLYLPISSATGVSIGWVHALFTATSAVSLTGLTVLDIGSELSAFGQVWVLMLVQLGGLGFISFGVMFAALLGKRITLKNRLLLQESTKAFSLQDMAKLAKYIIGFSFLLEGLGASILALYWSHTLGWKNAIYQAIFHAVSAFNNSGLSLHTNSLHAYIGDPIVNVCITLLSIIGGISFAVLLEIYQIRSWAKLSLHSKVVLLTSSILLIVGFVLILSIEIYNPATLGELSWNERLWSAWFQAVSPRSSGFSTLHTTALLTPTLVGMMLLMFIGTSTGSTGGGVKVNNIAVAYIAIYNLIRGNKDVNILKRRLDNQAVMNAMAIIVLAYTTIFLSTFLFSYIENIPPDHYMSAFFEVISAFSTVGLSMGITASLTTVGKCLLILTMFIGKIGPITIALALSTRSTEQYIRYPEDKVLIG